MKRLFSVFLSLMLSTVFLVANAATDDFELGSRKHIKTVALSIEGIHRDLVTYDVSADTLRAELTDRLTAAGVRVIDTNELVNYPEADVITLRLTLNRAPYYFYLYGLNMAVRNRVTLSPEGSGSTTIKTWSETRNGMLMPRELGNIRKMSLQLLDNLIQAHDRG